MKRLALLALALATLAPAQTKKPRLVVLISIDQFRHDYLARYNTDFLPAKKGNTVGGFRYLLESGADYTDAHHGHIPTATGPGHASLLTGAAPAIHGIIGNDWLDRATGRRIYCVEDPTVKTVGGPSKPMSPRNLLTTTVGDELKLATAGKAKVVSVSLKDRASILMSGHASDTVVWFDNVAMGWVSSTFYAPSGALPAWIQTVNGGGYPKQSIGKLWKPLLSADHYGLTKAAPFVKAGATWPFEHPIANMGDFWTSPYGSEFTIETAKKAITAEHLGEDEVPDLLTISLSGNDYVGHAFGPNSPEVADITIRTDRLLSDLFNTLDRSIPGGLESTLIILSADHGILPIPEESTSYRLPGERLGNADVLKALRDGLTASFGEGDWVFGWEEQNLYLNQATIAAKKLKHEDVENRAAELIANQAGIYAVLTRSQIMRGQVPDMNWSRLVTRSFYPQLSGDLVVIEKPAALFSGGTGTSHGSAWEYDSHVPIIFHGPGVQAGHYSRRVYTQDIASTVCTLLGIEYPTGNMGTTLQELLKK